MHRKKRTFHRQSFSQFETPEEPVELRSLGQLEDLDFMAAYNRQAEEAKRAQRAACDKDTIENRKAIYYLAPYGSRVRDKMIEEGYDPKTGTYRYPPSLSYRRK